MRTGTEREKTSALRSIPRPEPGRGLRGAAGLLAGGLLIALAVSCSDGGGITVSGGVAQLRFVIQPDDLRVEEEFTVAVELVTEAGQRATGATDLVSLSLSSGASLGGTTSVAAVGGLATFGDLSVSEPGSDLRLTASSGGLSVQSNRFDVRPVDPCAPKGPIALGETVSGTLTSASCVVDEVFFTDFWRLDLNAETTVQVDLTSADFDPFLDLFDLQGNSVGQPVDGGPGTERIEGTLPAGGYLIEASTGFPQATGDYELRVREIGDG